MLPVSASRRGRASDVIGGLIPANQSKNRVGIKDLASPSG